MNNSARNVRILFVTTSLHVGGAEKQLLELVSRLHGEGCSVGVVSLSGPGAISENIAALDIPLWHLNMNGFRKLPLALYKLVSIVRCFKPTVLQGWMYHGNLAALFAKYITASRSALMWGIRQSLPDIAAEKRGTRIAIRLGSLWSKMAHQIIYNSAVARAQHEVFGYAQARAGVIDNGFSIDRFIPDESARISVRNELGLAQDAILVGLVARYHPVKGHEMFLDAVSALGVTFDDTHFLLVGRDVDDGNHVLVRRLAKLNMRGRVHLLGERSDIPRLTAALDVAVSSSWGEAFPNAVGEAMSCGVPCVATDVGDVRRIIGDAGIIVPVGDSAALATALRRLLLLPKERMALGKTARQRIVDNFALKEMVAKYRQLYVRMSGANAG